MLLTYSKRKYKVMYINDFYIFTVIMQRYFWGKKLSLRKKASPS